LRLSILELEERNFRQELELKKAGNALYKSLQPIHILKNSISSVMKAGGMGNGLVKKSMGMAAGMLTKKILVRSSPHLLLNAMGTIIEFAVARWIAQKKDKQSLQVEAGSTLPHSA
jgi:hypothetical protein